MRRNNFFATEAQSKNLFSNLGGFVTLWLNMLEFSEQNDPLTERIIGCAIEIHRVFLDFLIEEAVVVELKSVERLDPLFEAQMLTYLRLSGKRRGLLINFNSRLLKDGVKRFVL